MRHLKQKTTLGRESGPRKALMRSLAESLILHGTIRTTAGKARALRRFVEPLITKAKKGGINARREIQKVLYTDAAINKLWKELGPQYKDRAGGYTRITKLAPRANDAAARVRIELV